MIHIAYTSQNKLIFTEEELMNSFLKHLANRIKYYYGGKDKSITIEEIIIRPDNRDPVYKNNYIFKIVFEVLSYNIWERICKRLRKFIGGIINAR